MAVKRVKRGRPKKDVVKTRVTMMMHPVTKELLQEMAEERGIGYQTLAQELLSEAVANWKTKKEAAPLERLALVAHGLKRLSYEAEEIELPKQAQESATKAQRGIRFAIHKFREIWRPSSTSLPNRR